jgi:hypothetical protein
VFARRKSDVDLVQKAQWENRGRRDGRFFTISLSRVSFGTLGRPISKRLTASLPWWAKAAFHGCLPLRIEILRSSGLQLAPTSHAIGAHERDRA